MNEKPTLNQLQYMSFTDEGGETVHFRLMDRIEPRWERFATALNFPQYNIAAMRSKDDPAYYLLSEWVRGANQDHSTGPLTWRTLITALREANIQDGANILEKYLVREPAQETESHQGVCCGEFLLCCNDDRSVLQQ